MRGPNNYVEIKRDKEKRGGVGVKVMGPRLESKISAKVEV